MAGVYKETDSHSGLVRCGCFGVYTDEQSGTSLEVSLLYIEAEVPKKQM